MSLGSKIEALSAARAEIANGSTAREMLAAFFDEGSFSEMDAFAKAGVVTGFGTVDGGPVYAFAQDYSVTKGAVGRVHGAKVKKVYEMAAKTGYPVVGIYHSDGALLGDGADSLGAYGEMLRLSNQISGVVPQISVVTGTCAGTAALIAGSADFVVMAADASLFMTPPFTLEAKGDKAEGTGTAEVLAKAGVVHFVEESTSAALKKAREIIGLLPINNLSVAPAYEYEAIDASQALRDVCESGNINADDVVAGVFDAGSVVEAGKEFAPGVFTGFARLEGSVTGVVAVRGTAHAGRLNAAACAKAARFIRLCDAFSIPLVTFVDSEGFVQCAAAESAGLVSDGAKLAHAYAEATTAKVAVITGKAYGPAYVALAGRGANADFVLAWAGAQVSALAPQTAVTVLYQDQIDRADSPSAKRAELEAGYAAGEGSAFAAGACGYVDDVIDPASTREKLVSAFEVLAGKRVSTLPKKHSNMPL